MISIQRIDDELLQFAQKIELLFGKSFGDRFDFCSFEEGLIAELHNLGCMLLKRVLETIDQYYLEHPLERDGWKVERGPEPKTILTNLGEVVYKRRYYRHQKTKQYRHIVDYISGIGLHEHAAPSLKAKLIERAAEMSYRKAAEGTEVTKQTVHNLIKKLSLKNKEIIAEPSEKRVVRTVYIEADEDHVALQNGKKANLPLIYVHEGWQTENGRRILINPFYITGFETPEELWYSTLDYICKRYDFEQIEDIFIGGDGANWIRKGVTIIPKAKFVLDRFHLVRYLKRASLGDKDIFQTLLALVRECNWDGLYAVLASLIKAIEDKKDRKKIKECLRYLRNNWDGIENYNKYLDKLYGISAEAHVSHILADRISSRPRGWSKRCLDTIGKLRALLAAGISIKEVIIKKLIREEAETGEEKENEKVRRSRGVALKYENYFRATMPSLRGPASQLTKALRSLASIEAI